MVFDFIFYPFKTKHDQVEINKNMNYDLTQIKCTKLYFPFFGLILNLIFIFIFKFISIINFIALISFRNLKKTIRIPSTFYFKICQ